MRVALVALLATVFALHAPVMAQTSAEVFREGARLNQLELSAAQKRAQSAQSAQGREQSFSSKALSTITRTPVYRFYNKTKAVHFYTISESEKNYLLANAPELALDGTAYYASAVAGSIFRPLHRFYKTAQGFHFYTADEAEKNNLLLNTAYIYEGVGYYVLGTNQGPSVSLSAPAAGTSFTAPANVTLGADADDADGTVASVAFYRGAALLGTDTTLPYTYSWANVAAGTYSITVGSSAQDELTYIHTDISGSPLVATNAQGGVVWKENYSAYGERRLQSASALAERQWFHGKEVDTETGLQYFGARYYDPAVGRFMGTDPVSFQEDNLHSFKRYAYGNNNPVTYSDPDGRYADLAIEAISITVGFHSLVGNAREANYGSAAIDGVGIVVDVGLSFVPLVPGGLGLSIKASREVGEVAVKGVKGLPDSALVCRGGTCSADRFATGSGVTLDAGGKLQGVSVNSGAGKSVEQLTVGIPNVSVQPSHLVREVQRVNDGVHVTTKWTRWQRTRI